MAADDPWQRLRDELDSWQAAGRLATLWWRDDDASAPTPALTTMLRLSADHHVPLGLAVIPTRISDDLAPLLAAQPHTVVLQHGFSHANHAPAAEKKAEFGAHRPLAELAADIADGWRLIASLPRAVPIFVPPWNRWTPALAPALGRAGIGAVSVHGPRLAREAAPGVLAFNTHADLIAWRTGRGFLGTVPALDLIITHLSGRRTGQHDASEPTGLLTHHLDHDDNCWAFLEHLFKESTRHPAVRWLSPDAMLGGAGAG